MIAPAKRRRVCSIGLLPTIVIALVALMGASAVVGFYLAAADQAKLHESRSVTSGVIALRQALVDAETGVRGFILTGRFEYLEPYFAGLQVIDGRLTDLLPMIDRFVADQPGTTEAAPVSRHIADLRKAWGEAIALVEQNQRPEAEAALRSARAKPLMDELRVYLRLYTAHRTREAEQAERDMVLEHALLLLINALGSIVAIAAMISGFRRSARESEGREIAIAASHDAHHQVEQLFAMTDMLQSAIDRADAIDVLRAAATGLMPGFGGALYVFNNSRDRLDLSTTWGEVVPRVIADHIAPGSCWALKRGKPHVNVHEAHGLRCEHWDMQGATLEIPMAARGEVYGLLAISDAGNDEARLRRIQPLAIALADAMSLSLSSISLREKLRNHALRDGLTGLYNRRFLEEMLERLTLDAERRKVSVSAIMIDLDHFKQLNDQYGHATGDAVLRAVGGAIASILRASDIACRYGGEELAILLPDCKLDHALAIAEQIRAAITVSTYGLAPVVTASFGVGSIPETAARASDLLPTADAALYQAKQQGRDRVVAAPTRPSARTINLVEPSVSDAAAD